MTNSSALDTLIELATTATDEAARRLGASIRAATDTENKLALLLQYRDDYIARLHASLASGLSPAAYRNFQQFLDKLDDAIDGQRQIVSDAQRQIGAQRAAWQQSERKRMSYDTLAVRAHRMEEQKQQRREQKQTDEIAARLAYQQRQN
jgi:flagellar FliJ protein